MRQRRSQALSMLRLMIARVVWAASRSSRTEMVEESGARACLAMMAIGAITAAAVSRRPQPERA